MWKYYDFSANWDEFLRLWNTPDIQEQSSIDISLLCLTNPFSILNRQGEFVTQLYKPGDPLWKYSTSYYWHNEAERKAQQRVHDENMVQKYKRSMENTGIQFRDQHHLEASFYDACFESVVKECFPKPNTIESFIITGAESALHDTYFKMAQDLFPHDIIFSHDNVVLVAYDKIIFDLAAYYFNRPIDQDHFDQSYTEYFSESDATDSW